MYCRVFPLVLQCLHRSFKLACVTFATPEAASAVCTCNQQVIVWPTVYSVVNEQPSALCLLLTASSFYGLRLVGLIYSLSANTAIRTGNESIECSNSNNDSLLQWSNATCVGCASDVSSRPVENGFEIVFVHSWAPARATRRAVRMHRMQKDASHLVHRAVQSTSDPKSSSHRLIGHISPNTYWILAISAFSCFTRATNLLYILCETSRVRRPKKWTTKWS